METMVEEIGVAVVDALEVAGYAESTIGQYRKSVRILVLLARKQGGVYTPGLGEDFASMTTSPRSRARSAGSAATVCLRCRRLDRWPS